MTAIPARLRSLPAVALLAGIVITLLIIAIRQTGGLVWAELVAYDWLIRAQAGSVIDPRVAVVMVTEQDIRKHGQYPITDAAIAAALERLVGYGARAIGMDIYRDIEVPPGRERLLHVLRTNPNIIVIKKFPDEDGRGTPPPPGIPTEQVGFSDSMMDADGSIRRALLYRNDDGRVAQSLSVRLALRYLAGDGIYPEPDPGDPRQLKLGAATITRFESSAGSYIDADDGGYQILPDFRGGRAAPDAFRLTDLLEGRIEPEKIRDKVILLGVHAGSVPDLVHTPVGGTVPGVTVHGLIVSQLLRAGLEGKQPIRWIPDWQESSWIFLWGILGVTVGLWARSSWRLAFGLLAGLAIIAATGSVSFSWGLWIPTVPPALAWVLSGSIVTAVALRRERQDRQVLQQLFGRYVSAEVAETIWAQRDQLLEGGRLRSQRMTITVLFADLQGFTTAAEKLAPDRLLEWVNSYLEMTALTVMEYGGVIDDYAGDGVKADFGVPVPRSSDDEITLDAVNAVKCAVQMCRRLEDLNVRWRAEHLPTMAMRIGIATGPVIGGSLGSSQRLEYSTLGDTVNVAARLQSHDPDNAPSLVAGSACRILIEEANHGHLLQHRDRGSQEDTSASYTTKRVGEVQVRGREHSVIVYQVLPESQGGK